MKLVHTDLNAFQAPFSVSLNVLEKSGSCSICRIYGPTFASLILGNFVLKYAKACPSLPRAFTNIFINPSLMCRGGRYTS